MKLKTAHLFLAFFIKSHSLVYCWSLIDYECVCLISSATFEIIRWKEALLLNSDNGSMPWLEATQITRFMGPTWVLSAPDGPHVGPIGPMNLVIRACVIITAGYDCVNIVIVNYIIYAFRNISAALFSHRKTIMNLNMQYICVTLWSVVGLKWHTVIPPIQRLRYISRYTLRKIRYDTVQL